MQNIPNLFFRKAEQNDIPFIWKILQQCIVRRKSDGSTQWQEGYPNLKTVEKDVELSQAYVLVSDNQIIGTAALIVDLEPTYDHINGKWLTNGNFLVVHRVGISDAVLGRSLSLEIFKYAEEIAKSKNLNSIRVDTHKDNFAMLRILEKLEYSYCGEIEVRDGKRKAFEKVLIPNRIK